jgi:hypothetical protein
MADHKYRLTYDVEAHPEGLSPDELEEGEGACDAAVILSMLYPEDGSYTWNITSVDGRTEKELDGDELWKAWLMLTKHLSIRDDMRPGKKETCHNVFVQVSSMLKQKKTEELH